ncbi:hypothetical protein [Caballeronia sp. 15711]|uniref:hypothetical protein n=1 Tax=Caballeronia sp. 15711 TaxID=3391029 RepID=UPI0039E5E228
MFGLYPAGAAWVRTFATEKFSARDIQKSLVDHAQFIAGIFHQPFGEQRGAVAAQLGKILVLSTPHGNATQFAVAPNVELQNLLWSFEKGFSTQWSAVEIRALTGYSGWDEFLIGVRHEFAAACEAVQKAVNGTLEAPPAPESTVHESFPDDDNDAFYAQMAELSQQPMEMPSCAL